MDIRGQPRMGCHPPKADGTPSHRRLRRVFFAVITVLSAGGLSADELAEQPRVSANVASPIQDDANLHDVQFLGSQLGWAVGDHGVIWHTNDAGRSWQVLPCPVGCSLRSVCFLSDRVGWIVGGTTMPFTRVGVGLVLATNDGGRTWAELSRGRLPQLHYVRFFSLNEGVLVGEATADFPTGVVTTHNGGKTWRPAQGGRRPGWRAADFLGPELGVTAGLDGTVARFDGNLSDVRVGSFGARTLCDVKLSSNDNTGWMVGDGALVLRTSNRGVVWEGPPTPLPEAASEICNFHALAVVGEKIWIAGTPGSVVWHSPDAGITWNRQHTGQTSPIERLAFVSDNVGWGVGAFGCILHTEDGGKTWSAARAGKRRAAILSISTRAREISFKMLAKESAELGYRSVVLLPIRGNGDGPLDKEDDVRLHDAVTAAGGSQGSVGWRFPLEVPGLDRDVNKLVADWMRRTEGRFEQAFYGDLVCQIRTWRPSVVIIDRPAPGDAAGNVLAQAVIASVRQAADPAAFPDQQNLAALAPWETSRVFFRQPRESGGDFLIDVNECLARLRSTVTVVAAPASSRIVESDPNTPETEAYRIAELSRAPGASDKPRDFFAGIALAPGGDARRLLPVLDAQVDQHARRNAQKDRNLRAIFKQQVVTATGGAELLAALRTAALGTDRAMAALRLATLADMYRQRAQWDLAEAVLVELVEQYPNEAATFEAMQWLFQYWTAAEPTYQRLRKIVAEGGRPEFRPSEVQESIDRAITLAATDPKDRDPLQNVVGADGMRVVNHEVELRTSAGNWIDLKLKEQRGFAIRMASLIRKKSPALFRTPAIQFPLATALRNSGLRSLPGEKVEMASAEATGSEASAIFDREAQKMVGVSVAPKRPTLDGMLSDDCWHEAAEIPLYAESAPVIAGAPHAFLMLTYDAQYLYFAISIPRESGWPKKETVSLGRRNDQDLSQYDRVAIDLDVDRDYLTSYTIEIDERGCVAESCWGDFSWNPKLYISATSDDDRWRIEGAIPFRELVAKPPRPGDGWGLAAVRTIPAVRLESWGHPAASRPRPESYGLLRFK